MPTRIYTLACTDGHKQLILMPKTETNQKSSTGTKSNRYGALAHITAFYTGSGRSPAVKHILSLEADSPFSSLCPNLHQLSRIPVKHPLLKEGGSLLRPAQWAQPQTASSASPVCYFAIPSEFQKELEDEAEDSVMYWKRFKCFEKLNRCYHTKSLCWKCKMYKRGKTTLPNFCF